MLAAARNNAEWCDSFCRAHGIVGTFGDDAWWSAERTPPLYPDAVTLVPGVDARALVARIDGRADCSVKDSFGDLDLAAEGFDVLFRAEWMQLDQADVRDSSWCVVETASELARWETAWGTPPEPLPFFRPALLANESIAILGRYDGDRIVGGAIANRSVDVIGLSNVFDHRGELASTYGGAASAAQERWGALPVVGYESGSDLDAAREAGFVPTGELVVWVIRDVDRD